MLYTDGQGKRIWTRVASVPFRDEADEVDGLIIVVQDIDEEKRAAEARARLAAIVESSEDAIVSKDLEGTIVSWNTGAEHIFGYKAEEVIGKSITILMPPDRWLKNQRSCVASEAANVSSTLKPSEEEKTVACVIFL
jgi:PAS domain-containing protein